MGKPWGRVMFRQVTRIVCLAFLLPLANAGSPALAQDAFFKGREIKLIVGTGAGGGYNAYARLVARYLPKYIPGQPTFVVQTMPGASGVKAVNYLYAAAPKDGSVISTFNNSMAVYQALGQPGIQFKNQNLEKIHVFKGVESHYKFCGRFPGGNPGGD